MVCVCDETGVLSAKLVEALAANGLTLATAESCTGGAVSAAITSVAGCSSVMRGAVVAYHNEVKVNLLGVSASSLEEYGAVSKQVVEQMVCGVARVTGSDCAMATTGVAGPGGGTQEKPVGTVWIAAYIKGTVEVKLLSLGDKGRLNNVKNTVLEVLHLMNDVLNATLFSKIEK
ncbi:MAG: CinA family protein [Bacteroidaceae bacterium]|nr:CinA family protein [Bacteroidaceae bacterium]